MVRAFGDHSQRGAAFGVAFPRKPASIASALSKNLGARLGDGDTGRFAGRKDSLPLLECDRDADDGPKDRVLIPTRVPRPAKPLDDLEGVDGDCKHGCGAERGVTGTNAQDQAMPAIVSAVAAM